MMLNSLSVLCLSLLLFNIHFSLARRGKSSTSSRTNTRTTGHRNTGGKSNHGSGSSGGSKQPGHNQGGSPYGGGYGHGQGGWGGHGQGGWGGHGQGGWGGHGQGGWGSRGQGGWGGHGGHGWGYSNPNNPNKIRSPYIGNSGYGGRGSYGGGSPFSNYVQSMGKYPSENSKTFGRTAVMAAGAGAMTGMALGYGLGRFPRPQFEFRNRQEEQYYNNYMYRKYDAKSTDSNVYSRSYSQPSLTYDDHMKKCMNRKDLLPVEKPKRNPVATTTITTTTVVAPVGDVSKTAKNNATDANSSSSSVTSTQPAPPTSQVLRQVGSKDDDDDDTVSIMEIGYPALIEQMKIRRCVELYLTAGAQAPAVQLVVSTTAVLMLLSSNMLMLF